MNEETTTVSVTDLSNEKERKYYFNFPHLDGFETDTWRLMDYFEEAKQCYEDAGEVVNENMMEVLKKVWINFNISSNKHRVINKNLGLLTPEFLLSIATDKCKCCRKKLWYGRCHNGMTPKQKEDGYVEPSLDRMDNTISKEGGYVDTNVWIVCKKCNTKKSDSVTPDELYRIADAWTNESYQRKELYEQYCKDNRTTLEQDMTS